MPDQHRSRWGVILEGHSFDLEDWEDDLRPPFDPLVTKQPDKDKPDTTVWILQSESFESCASASEVREVAIPLIRTLSGLIGVKRDARRVTLGDLIEFREDGSWNRRIAIGIGRSEGRSKARGIGAALIGGVEVEPAPPTPSYAQSMIHDLSDDLRAAVRYYDMADNEYDLYKSYEAVLSHLNQRSKTKAKEKLKKLGFTEREVDFDSSLQHSRHYKTSASKDFTFREAKALTRRIIDAVLQASSSS